MSKLLLALGLVFSISSFAKKTEGVVLTTLHKKEIELTIKSGFHFNDKAPASAVFDNLEAKFKPTTKTEQKLTFKIVENSKKAKLNYYVCDDEKTVCEPHEQIVALTTKPAEPIEPVEQKQKETNTTPNDNLIQRKTTLLKFSAPWCPACIRLSTETLNKVSVQKQLKKISFKEINIDLVENEKISDKYEIKAIPTLVLVNEQGEEIKRWLDYQPEKSFLLELKTTLSQTQQSTKEKLVKAEAGDETAISEVAFNFYNKMNWKDAIKWFSLSKGQKEFNYKLASEINLLADEAEGSTEAKKNYLKALEKGATLSTYALDRARWKLEYLEQLKDEKSPIDQDLVKSLRFTFEKLLNEKNLKKLFESSTFGDAESFEKAEVLNLQLRLAKISGDSGRETLLKKELENNLDSIKYSTNIPGQMVSAIWHYNNIETPQKAEKLLVKLVEVYPRSYVYHQRYASFLSKQKRFDEALKQIDLALEFKEGNEPQLNLSKIKILKGLGKKTEATSLIDVTLKITEDFQDKYKRTRTTLLDLKKEIKDY